MFTADAKFYTVKQIDDFLDKNGHIYDWGVASREHARNILIDRLKTRLAIANGMFHSIKGETQAKVLMDLGFANYKKFIETDWSRNIKNPTREIEENFHKFAGDVLDKVGGITEAKFVFCDDSIEFKLHTEDDIDYSFVLFYDTPDEMLALVEIPNKSSWTDGQKSAFIYQGQSNASTSKGKSKASTSISPSKWWKPANLNSQHETPSAS